MRWLILILLLVACQKDDDGFIIYTIKSGDHTPKRIGNVNINKHSLQAEFKVNETWFFEDNGCWNKVLGLSEGDHRENSCRLAYRPNGIVGMYVWADGERKMFAIDTLSVGTYYVDIGRVGGEWHLTLNGKTWTAKAGERKDINYRLYPYVGGDKTISTDWVVPIKWH